MQYIGSKLEFKCRTLQLKFPEIAYSTEMLIVMTMDKQIGIFYFILQLDL